MENEIAVVPNGDVAEENQQINAEQLETAKTEEVGDEGEQAKPEQGETEEQRGKRKGGWQRKIEKLERQNETLQELLLSRTEKKEQPEAKPEKFTALDPKDPMPDLDSFSGTLKEFNTELASWSVRQAKREFASEQQAKEQASTQKTQAEKWTETESSFSAEHDDYEDVRAVAEKTLRAVEKLPGVQGIVQAVTDPELGPALLYELGKDPEQLRKLAAMNPVRALMELGKLQLGLAKPNKAESEPPPKTKAPKPLTPVNKPASTDKFDPNDPKWAEKTSPDEWARQRTAELKKQGKR